MTEFYSYPTFPEPIHTPPHPGGRPRVIDEVTLQKLETAFKIGCPDEEACFYAGISTSTLYNYQNETEGYLEQKKLWKRRPVLKARQVIIGALESNDLNTAKWYLERKDDEMATKTKLEHSGSIPVTNGETNQEDQEAIEKFHQNLKDNMLKRSMEKARVDGEIP